MRFGEALQSDSIRELAAFWDTHDLTEFEGELEEVSGTVFERQASLVTVPLRPTELQALKKLADSKGIGCNSLIPE